jgi:hypothetical protein
MSFPGYGGKDFATKPLPPKYLEITNEKGEQVTVETEARKTVEKQRKVAHNAAMPKELPIVDRGRAPYVHTKLAESVPIKSFDSEPHRFRAAVDSKYEAKGTASQKLMTKVQNDGSRNNRNPTMMSTMGMNAGAKFHGFTGERNRNDMMPFIDDHTIESHNESVQAPPKFIGSSYNHLPNHHTKNFTKPWNPRVPRPYVPQGKHFFAGQAKLSNRTTSGAILGDNAPTYIDPNKVPHADPAELGHQPVAYNDPYAQETQLFNVNGEPIYVNADNPVEWYDNEGIWSACWDDGAEAVYYYNNQTGEASWLPPET